MIVGVFFTIGLIAAFVGIFYQTIRENLLPPERRFHGPRPPRIDSGDTVADARSLQLGRAEIKSILEKRFPYYTDLPLYLQARFLYRTQAFINNKLFIIKNEPGFREMPVLTAAAGVQLTFGLEDYRLPWFRYIRIYHQAFLSEVALRLLAGNVSDRTITVAWNHLLHGYAHSADGNNVALHEMSHALYVQRIEVAPYDDSNFRWRYQKLMRLCSKAHQQECFEGGLYTAYGLTNLQEFWAESVELFFERSADLQQKHPAVYKAMVRLLNQNPLTKQKIVHLNTLSFLRKMAARF